MMKRRGRPPKMGAVADAVVSFRMTREQYRALKEVARANRETIMDFCRDAVNGAASESGERRIFPAHR